MGFKNFNADMRMILNHNQADGGLKMCFRDGQLSFHLMHYTSEIEIRIPEPDLPQIAKILDQLCIVVSTNTFFKLDLVEVKQSAKKTYQEISNYLWSAWR